MTTAAAQKKAEKPQDTEEPSSYKDGVYTGSARGFGGDITVEVTVRNGKISGIKVISAPGEGDSYLKKAKSLISRIIDGQTTNVDTVSGATFSSAGLINAVRAALKKAGGREETSAPETTSAKEDKEKKKTKKETAQSDQETADSGEKQEKDPETDSAWKDGTYEGEADGFGGKIKVSVTIKKGEIRKIKILEADGETPAYLKKAKSLCSTIIREQTADVDVVSGATYSSKGIIGAVRKALNKASRDSEKNKKEKKTDKKKDKKKKKDPAAEDSEKQTTQKSKEDQTAGQKEVQPTAAPEKVDSSGYADGTFTGTGEGFEGDLTVSVTIRNGKIVSAKLTDWEDDEPYITKASALLSDIVSADSTDVDIVSGASYSSRGILQAVADALEKSRKKKAAENAAAETPKEEPSGEQETKESRPPSENGPAEESSPSSESGPETESTPAEESSPSESGNEEESTEETAGSVYADGTYHAEAVCRDVEEDFYDYIITAEVTIEKDRIIAVTDITGDDDANNQIYLSRAAKKIVPKIIGKGMPEGVDTISGATCSSRAILELCENALEQARK